ncbi:MAG: hypothetical protein ACKO3I_11730 [Synechococcales cyanobacterium]|nr:hypothetical protein [Cyanobacteria bacterium REEB444]
MAKKNFRHTSISQTSHKVNQAVNAVIEISSNQQSVKHSNASMEGNNSIVVRPKQILPNDNLGYIIPLRSLQYFRLQP